MRSPTIERWKAKIDRDRWMWVSDVALVGAAIALPWTTSGTSIFIGIWLIAAIPTLDVALLRRVLLTQIGALPVLLWVLAAAGMLWAGDLSMSERLAGLKPYHRLLLIPLFITYYYHSVRGWWVMVGFIASCTVVLIVSWLLFVSSIYWPIVVRGGPGIPVRDYVAQSLEFIVCTCLLVAIAIDAWKEKRRGLAIALLVLAFAFLFNVVNLTASRTALAVIPVVLLLFAVRFLSWKATAGLLAAVAVSIAIAWPLSYRLSSNITAIVHEIEHFDPDATIPTRVGERLVFWQKSVNFIAAAPVFGHGTGSIPDQFRRSTVGRTGMAAEATKNPHNQALAIGIQLGFVGMAVLFAMWLSHLLVFRGTGFVAWVGVVIVAQNIVGSLFHTHLFDFVEGWGYVLGFGMTAGMLLHERDGAVTGEARGEISEPSKTG